MTAVHTSAPRRRRVTRAAIALLGVVVFAGCSSDAKKSDSGANKKSPVESSTSSTAIPSSSTSSPSVAPCTVEAATAALRGASETANSIVCGDGWAAGGASNPDYDLAYLLRDVNGNWTNEGTNSATMDAACATGNPLGIPQAVLDSSPCKAS